MKTKTKVAVICFVALAAILTAASLVQRSLNTVTVDLASQSDQIASVKIISSDHYPLELSIDNEEMAKDIEWLVNTLSGEYHAHKLKLQLNTSSTSTLWFTHIQFYDKDGNLLKDIAVSMLDSHPRFILRGDESSRFILYYTSPYETDGNNIFEWYYQMDDLVEKW